MRLKRGENPVAQLRRVFCFWGLNMDKEFDLDTLAVRAGITRSQFNEHAGGQTVFHLHVHLVPRYVRRPGLKELFVREPDVDLDRVHRQLIGRD